ncbi:type II toxin-antitoxin system Phd/YefM family antitoxin [Candidatus Parcubacteria bacterium]|nr:type II toxin-antitoxin system Phd/YefM family antitoxin [Candidatus Parcubacteria bacterium]
MPKEVSALKMRHNLGEILNQVANQRLRFVVKRAGIPAAILMSIQDYEDLEDLVETAVEEAGPKFQRSLLEGRKAIDAGRFTTAADLRRDLRRKEAKVRRTGKRSR